MAQQFNTDAERHRRPDWIDSVMLPPPYPGVSDALRLAYPPSLDEISPEVRRLLARLY